MATSNAAFVASMKTTDVKQVGMYEDQLKKLRDELAAALAASASQKEV
jgi:hypothetical protein